jgi:hypothetical protein
MRREHCRILTLTRLFACLDTALRIEPAACLGIRQDGINHPVKSNLFQPVLLCWLFLFLHPLVLPVVIFCKSVVSNVGLNRAIHKVVLRLAVMYIKLSGCTSTWTLYASLVA